MFRVDLTDAARDAYARADPPLARKVARCFHQLERDPRRHSNIKRLTGQFAGLFRYRIGDWRVLYRIDDSSASVLVHDISHRRDVYE